MAARFERNGVSFQYPENWQVLPERYQSGWAVTVQSPGTAFLTVTCDDSKAGMGELADAALRILSEEYKQSDVEPFSGTIAGLPAIGHDVDFFSFDLTNSCLIRTVAIGQGVLLLVGQASDVEENFFRVLQAIVASIEIDEDN